MSDECLKDIIVALIENEYFEKYVDNVPENLARDIAIFQKEYFKELKED